VLRGRVAVLAVRALLRQVFATDVNDWAGEGAGAPRASRRSEPALAWSVLCQRDHAETQGRGGSGVCTHRQVFATGVNDWAGEGAGAPRASRRSEPALAWSVLCQRDHAETQGRGGGGVCTLRQVFATGVNDWAGEGAGAPWASRPFTFDRPGILTPWQCRPVLPIRLSQCSPGNWCPSPAR